MLQSVILVKHAFAGIHCWEDCPIEEVSFLGNPHRHIFHVEVKLPVTHNDRDLEFFMVLQFLKTTIERMYVWENGIAMLGSSSCEMIAEDIVGHLSNEYSVNWAECYVSEDGENGAIVKWTVD